MTKFLPSMLVNNVFDPISRDELNIIKVYKRLEELNFYKSLEVRMIFNPDIRKEFAQMIKKNNWSVTYWLTSNLNNSKLSLSDINENKRFEAVDYTKHLIDLAHDGDGEFVGIISGPIQSNIEYEQDQFVKSLRELSDYIAKYEKLKIMIEPLDVFAHKKNVIGDLNSTTKLFETISTFKNAKQIILCIDLAHFALNENDLHEVIKKLAIYSNRIHFANAILDPKNAMYGDHHMRMGGEGYLNDESAAKIIRTAKDTKFKCDTVYLTNEVRGTSADNLWALENETRDFISKLLI